MNLKLSGEPLPYDKGDFARLSALIDDRPVVVAASTHEHEEMAIVGALDHLADRLFLIVVPRHPERGDAIAESLGHDGYRFARRSQGQPICDQTDIYLADTLGELGLFLRLADVVVMGGSFAPALGGGSVGGHNPLEPARLAKPIVTGPDASNWQAVTRMLKQAGGLVSVLSPAELPSVVGPMLADPEAARDMGERARRSAEAAAAGLDRLWLALQTHLPAAPSRRRP